MEISNVHVDELPPFKKALRICVVTETYPPDVNGVSLTLSRVVEGLRGRGHHVWLVRPRHPEVDQAQISELDQHWVRGLPLPMYRHVRLGMPSTQILKRLWSRQRPDVVHIATEGPLGWSALSLARKMKIAVTSDFRTNFHTYSHHYKLGWLQAPILRYLKKFHNRCDFTMAPTRELVINLNLLGFERLRHVPRGVDTHRFSPSFRSKALRDSWGVGDNTLVLTCISRLAAEKNLELVIRTWRYLRSHDVDSQLVLVGDGPLRLQLQKDHPDIIFAGFKSGQDLSTHYASADLFVFPSVTETFGNVTLEAMASGLPVLAFRCAAAGEVIVPGEHGALVEAGEQAFIDAGLTMIQDLQQLRRMGEKGRAKALSCSWPAVFELTEEIMHEAWRLHGLK